MFTLNVNSIFAFNNCTQVGNTSFCDDGTYYNQVGNTVYGSNGTSYSQFGNTTSQDTCPYNSTLDYVTQKCKCNNGYEYNGSKCVYKNPNIIIPPKPLIPIITAPAIPTKIPITTPKINNQIIPSEPKGSSGGGGGGGSAPKTYTKIIAPVVEKVIQKEVITENPPIETKLDPVVDKVKPKSFWNRLIGWFNF